MPIILDRLPLPNISWYTAFSFLCLLCSVYYAGVQVKLHPDWKEQLKLRQSTPKGSDFQENIVLFEKELDNYSVCFKEDGSKTLYDEIRGFNRDLCKKESFEDVINSIVYAQCYVRYNPEDAHFRQFIFYNAYRLSKDFSTYQPDEYFSVCKKWLDSVRSKHVEPEENNFSTLNSTEAPDLYEENAFNRCSGDSFYDSYERDINSEMPLYRIQASHEVQCGEREMSPYLIPEIISFMFHEPLCIWTLINMAYCILILLGTTIQHMVFGELRVSEQQHIKDKFWNFVFYKFIFVFGVMNVKHMDEAVLWCSWFSVLGFLHLLAQLCKDRFEYLSFSGYTGRRTHIRLLCLLGIILLVASVCLLISVLVGCHAGINTFAFMAAECILLIVRTLYVITRYSIYLWDISHQGLWERRGSYVYLTELLFELSELVIDMVHHIHMLLWGNITLTMASLVICMQLRLLFYQLQHKVKTHKNHLRVRKLMASYKLVTPEESVTCLICWEDVTKGRQLPCTHLFHTSCLLDWLPQHLSCPTCRHNLKPAPSVDIPVQGNFISRLFSRRSSDPLVNDFTLHTPSESTAEAPNSESTAASNLPSRAVSSEGGNLSSSMESLDKVEENMEKRNEMETETSSSSSQPSSSGEKRDEDAASSSAVVGGSGGGGSSSSSYWEELEDDEGRYVSWLSSFSVEQRHTQLPRQHTPQAPSGVLPQSSLASMAGQVVQMFPKADYETVMEDLSSTRSAHLTIDNILEGRLKMPLSGLDFNDSHHRDYNTTSKVKILSTPPKFSVRDRNQIIGDFTGDSSDSEIFYDCQDEKLEKKSCNG